MRIRSYGWRAAALAACVVFLLVAAIHSQAPAGAEFQLKAFTTHQAMAEASPYKALPWQSIGPSNNTGRMTSIAVADDSGRRTIYVGAATGGVWKSDDRGDTWRPIFEHEATASIGDVAVAPSNHNIVWVGTGEDNLFRAGIAGTGIYKSIDAGKTWQQMGLDRQRHHRPHPRASHQSRHRVRGGVGPRVDAQRDARRVQDDRRRQDLDEVLLSQPEHGRGGPRDGSDPIRTRCMRRMWQRIAPEVERSARRAGLQRGRHLEDDRRRARPGRRSTTGSRRPKFRGRVGVDISRSNPNVVYAIIDSYDAGPTRKTRRTRRLPPAAAGRQQHHPGLEVFRSDNKGRSWRKVSGQTPEIGVST